jgi:hypothetical protein
MTDEQDRAEQLDDEIIADDEDELDDGELRPDDDRFEQIAALDEEYPPDEPLGVEDDGRFGIEDDLASREDREVEDNG